MVKVKTLRFFSLDSVLFQITIYLVIEQILLNLPAHVEFMKITQPVSWCIETKSDIEAQQNFRRN